MKKDLNIEERVCNEKEMTIEEQVSLCFPKATKEEQQRIADEWKAKARRMATEPDFGLYHFGRKPTKEDLMPKTSEPPKQSRVGWMEHCEPDSWLMQFPHDTGHWQRVKKKCMNDATETAYPD